MLTNVQDPHSKLKLTPSATPAHSGYRPDIDGLRAIAILSVVLYHLKFRYCRGGFVGVDIFLVISGYLITNHVASEVREGKFSLVTFYERRIRRIFPAMLAMLFCTAILAYSLLLPEEIIDYAKSLVAAVCSVSNFYFFSTAGYFNAGEKPLLHTWSLALEEQFYLLLPPLLLLLHRFARKSTKPIVAAIALCSLLFSAFTVFRYPEATFYLLPARAWELLLGGMLGMGILRVPANRVARQLMGLAGLVLMAVAIFVYTPTIPFPGLTALVPCVGAVLVIASGGTHNTIADWALSRKPIVGVGLISYSLYLWHVPIIFFQHCTTAITFGKVLPRIFPFISVPQAVTVERYILLLSLSFLMAFLSWKYVEQPFRKGRFKPERTRLFQIAAFSSFALILAGGVILARQGLPQRFSPRVLTIASYTTASEYRRGSCFITGAGTPYDESRCLASVPGKPNWLLMGDSHAAMLAQGIIQADPEINLLQANASGCKPVRDKRIDELRNCFAIMHTLYESYLPANKPNLVILAANWQIYDLSRLSSSIAYLKNIGQHVVVVGPVMQYDSPLPRLLATEVSSNNLSLAASHRILSYDALDMQMQKMAADRWQVPYISYRDLFCPKGNCLQWGAPDIPLQSDTSHLTDAGSVVVAKRLRSADQLQP